MSYGAAVVASLAYHSQVFLHSHFPSLGREGASECYSTMICEESTRAAVRMSDTLDAPYVDPKLHPSKVFFMEREKGREWSQKYRS